MIRYRKLKEGITSPYKRFQRLNEYKRGDGGIKIPGYKGKWYVIDQVSYTNPRTRTMHIFSLLESELYGDEAENLLIDEFGNVVAEGMASARELLRIAIDGDNFDY